MRAALLLSSLTLAVTTTAFVFVPYVPESADPAAHDRWKLNAWEFNAAPYIIPTCFNCSAPLEPLPTVGIFFAHSPSDAFDAARAALMARVGKLQARSGRHSYIAAAAMTPGAAVVDVSNLTHVSPVFQTTCPSTAGSDQASVPCTAVHVGPGLKLFALYANLSDQGYSFPGGSCPTVGLSGFTLGGGIGLWSRSWGLAVDNVLALDAIVYNDSAVAPERVKLVHVTPESDPHLFRAFLGAGNNNFGIVVNMTLRVYPVPPLVSRWRINYGNFSACRDSAFPLLESGVRDDWADVTAGRGQASVAIAFDVYDSSCAAIVSGFNVTADALVKALSVRGWLNVTGASADPLSGPTEAAWPTAVANSAGCDTVEDCMHRIATELPNPSSPGRWQALTSFQFEALSEKDREALFTAVGNTSAMDKDKTFVVAIVDMLGGAVNNSALDSATTFVHHTALYHVQILAYLSSDDYGPSERAWEWADGVLGVLDGATISLGRAPAAYRNYPSRRLAHANQRYYGSLTLEWLQNLRRRRDPLGLFTYPGGL